MSSPKLKTGPTVFVGLSGGVDSSVAALRLKERGFNVVGVFIKVWQPDFLRCNWEEERLDAMRVAAHLSIPFLTCDAAEEYRREVGEYFVKEYQAGRTPNPDVMCNRHVKFGAFWQFARERGADFIATGHYAQVANEGGEYRLLRGRDDNKDQSYFLWTLTQDDLKHTLFPVGDSTKDEIRDEAAKADLPTAVKKDSQGICFLGQVDIPEFLSHFTKLSAGPVINPHGERIGSHEGALVYTLGQRHGFSIDNKSIGGEPHYVVAKDIGSNTLVVDTKPPVVAAESAIRLGSVNIINGQSWPEEVEAQFRYRQSPIKMKSMGHTLQPLSEMEKPSAGQSCVVYRGGQCLGGGVVE